MDSIDAVYSSFDGQPDKVKNTAFEIVKYLHEVIKDGTIIIPEENYESELYPVLIEFHMARYKFLFQIDNEGSMEVWRGSGYLGDSLDDFSLALFFEWDY